ncbi:flagellar protein FlaG [Alteromonas sp. 1_MG-2023]|uniref:flagellar protein FlaG n=1 Tax=Alteromonas sp. 1_MG-2023 TaxID=3062669 RepID=UPI0026E14A60|nr:flagellar protein FlaG [Alteromonas sp. 1_MG-2023]MDO6568455.1 flagellar protein FlaG [Alteromonas sp. 1_MG-2023]
MEIANNQVGQAFASQAYLSTTPESKPSPVSVNNAEGIVANHTNDNTQGSNSNTPLQQNQAGQIISQETDSAADTDTSSPDQRQLAEALSEVESFLQVQNRNLAFSIDEETERSVVTVKDSQSGDVIRQIPSEEVLAIAERIQDLQQDVGDSIGLFVNNRI